MCQHSTQHLPATPQNPTSITTASSDDIDCARTARPFASLRAIHKMTLLLRRDHGANPLPGMMLFNKSSKFAARKPN
jgi:hypothetical protein